MKILKVKRTESFTLPAGRYIISDPCYVVAAVDWGQVVDSLYGNRDVIETAVAGYVRDSDGAEVTLIALPTAHGDGSYYEDYMGLEFGVDSGLIGIMACEDFPNFEEDRLSHIYDFPRAFGVKEQNGVLHFGHIRIDTN